MLLSSLGLSLLTTFEAFAARDGLEILAWDANQVFEYLRQMGELEELGDHEAKI